MAGTIALSMTQQFNSLGVPLSGGKLYVFQTGTTTPQNAFSDSGLTAALANPLTLDSSGRVPQFFLADGSIKVRLTDKTGVVQAEWDNLLVVGPSSGSGGSGSTVDPNALFQTGDVMWLDISGVRSGWVRDNGRSIGSATSGAAERANSDCQSLFVWLWTNFSNTICPVSTGRGATALLDWAANKTITLPDKRNKCPVGLDDMGNSAAAGFTSVPFTLGNATTAGSVGGEALHALTSGEMPSHTHTATVTDPEHSHVEQGGQSTVGTSYLSAASTIAGGATSSSTSSAATGITVANANAGGGTSHNNMQPFVLGTFFRKL